MICIDPKIAALLTPLTSEEAALLEFSIKTEGCRDPLTIWSQGNTLLDGHHRQLGRRNLTPLQASPGSIALSTAARWASLVCSHVGPC